MSHKKYDEMDLYDIAERTAGAVAEKIQADLQLVLELVATNGAKVDNLLGIKNDVTELKSDMKVVKLATKDTSKDLYTLENRVVQLEAASSHA